MIIALRRRGLEFPRRRTWSLSRQALASAQFAAGSSDFDLPIGHGLIRDESVAKRRANQVHEKRKTQPGRRKTSPL